MLKHLLIPYNLLCLHKSRPEAHCGILPLWVMRYCTAESDVSSQKWEREKQLAMTERQIIIKLQNVDSSDREIAKKKLRYQ